MFSRSKWCTEYQLGERFFQRFKSKVPLIARDDLAFPRLQVDNGAKTVLFQLENVIGMVEGLPHQAEPHGVNAREHNSSLSLRLWMPASPLSTSLQQLPL